MRDELELRHPFGKNLAPTREDIENAIEGARMDDGFALLRRGSDFVQFNGTQLERGDGERIWRVDLEAHARKVFAAVHAGEDVPDDLPWRDVTDEIAAEKRANARSTMMFVLGLLALGLLGAATWFLWLKDAWERAHG